MNYIRNIRIIIVLAFVILIGSLLLLQANGIDALDKSHFETDFATQVALNSISTTGSEVPLGDPEKPVEFFNPIFIQTAQSTSLINLDDFRGDARFLGIDGSNVAVVILDTGIDLNHPAFGPDLDFDNVSDRIVYQYDFADGDNDATDVHGHGSNVSSIVASSDGTFTGMAPDADIIHLKVFPNVGSGNFSYVESALQWVVANAATYNVVSVNMSLGDTANHTSAPALYGVSDEILALVGLGVTVVSASGNDFATHLSVPGVGYPAADVNSFSVGAVFDSNVGGFAYSSGAENFSSAADVVTPFSQRHSTLSTIFAPGAPIVGAGATGGWSEMHGTSQASPHIAGIVALMQELALQELGRKLTVVEVESLMVSTAVTINDGDDENDNVTNTNLDFPRVDMLAIGEAILLMADPAPKVSFVNSDVDTGDNVLEDGEATNVDIVKLHVTFSEEVVDPVGDGDANDVTNPSNYLLLSDGLDDVMETAVCGTAQGDDGTISIDDVVYNSGIFSATLTINSGTPLASDNYQLFVCKEIEDGNGSQLDGDEDGTAGDDFSLSFSIDKISPNGNGIVFVDFNDPDNTPTRNQIDIIFPEPMNNSGSSSSSAYLGFSVQGGASGEVTNPANYLLLSDGIDETIDTTTCGLIQGDDQSVTIDSVTYDANSDNVTLSINSGQDLPIDSYRLFVCGTIEDSVGNAMGSDIFISFTVTMSYIYLPLIVR